jgi:hypothetical protein
MEKKGKGRGWRSLLEGKRQNSGMRVVYFNKISVWQSRCVGM